MTENSLIGVLQNRETVNSSQEKDLFKGAQSRLNGLKSLAKLFSFVVYNPCQSSPSLTILVPLGFIIISLVFFYLCKALFSSFVDDQNNTKYRDCTP